MIYNKGDILVNVKKPSEKYEVIEDQGEGSIHVKYANSSYLPTFYVCWDMVRPFTKLDKALA